MSTEHGGKIELVLRHSSDERVTYDVELHAPHGRWLGSAVVNAPDGSVALSFDESALPPDWLNDFARQVLRTVWRACAEEAHPAWPRRITRWRKGPTEVDT